jgi:phosphoglycolate phosphatase-like HAD superfamily hydrolase
LHVGDTPYDVLAAKDAEFLPVGTPQGKYKAEELTSHVPETVIIPDWKDTNQALKLLGLLAAQT